MLSLLLALRSERLTPVPIWYTFRPLVVSIRPLPGKLHSDLWNTERLWFDFHNSTLFQTPNLKLSFKLQESSSTDLITNNSRIKTIFARRRCPRYYIPMTGWSQPGWRFRWTHVIVGTSMKHLTECVLSDRRSSPFCGIANASWLRHLHLHLHLHPSSHQCQMTGS